MMRATGAARTRTQADAHPQRPSTTLRPRLTFGLSGASKSKTSQHKKGRSFPLRALVAGSIRYLKVSPWPGRFAILNRNRAKDYGITVPSSNFFGDGGSAWHAKLRSGQTLFFRRALYPASFDRGREPPPNSADRSEAIIAARG
jgi:hypothetical protein